MADDVAQTFLHDPVATDRYFCREHRCGVSMDIGYLDFCAGGEIIDLASNGFHESKIVEDGGVKSIGHLAHVIGNGGQPVGDQANRRAERLRVGGSFFSACRKSIESMARR